MGKLLSILTYFGKRKQVTYCLNLSYVVVSNQVLPSVLFFQVKFHA